MTSPFVILGTPRSRTAWLAKFLAFEGRHVLHEPSADFRSLDELYSLLDNPLVAGIVDSMLTFRWRDILVAQPEARLVLVSRDKSGVIASLMRTGIFIDHIAENQLRLMKMLQKHACAMEELRGDAVVLSVPYSALSEYHVADQVFRYCLREPLPLEWWQRWRHTNVQVDVHEIRRRAIENIAGLRAVFPELDDAVVVEGGA